MYKIFSSILICAVLFIPSISNAEVLKPSLSTQMTKQDQLNKRNIITQKLAEKARIKQEAKARIEAQKYRALTVKNKILESKNTASQSNTLVPKLTIPPVPQKLETPTLQWQVSSPSISKSSNIPSPPNVDMNRVRSEWLTWTNSVRLEQWLSPYSIDTRLNTTAYDWTIEFANSKWSNHHRRNPSDSYYSFSTIDNWFMKRGINPKIINRSKHTENVGFWTYSCSSSDCTNTLIQSIRSTFNFFMSEKGKSYDAHYRSIVQPNFSKIGLSVIVVPEEQRYYLTVHYITE